MSEKKQSSLKMKKGYNKAILFLPSKLRSIFIHALQNTCTQRGGKTANKPEGKKTTIFTLNLKQLSTDQFPKNRNVSRDDCLNLGKSENT